MIPRLPPAALLVVSFAGLILAGAVVLALPSSGAGGRPIPAIDALFTATSAVCVTGLTVVDTAERLSGSGRGWVLLLIQLGGLGILTFSIFFAMLLGRKVSMAQRDVVASAVSPLRRVDVLHVLKRILGFTFAIESAGAAALWLFWRGRYGDADAAWHAVFHAVSAFCNAGFSTFSTSLLDWRGHWGVNLVVMALIILGGIGFVVFLDIENRIRYRTRVGLHSRVVLATSAVLIAIGAVLFAYFESQNTLEGASRSETVAAALFASVTPRTAGFNTIDYAHATAATLVLTIVLMFVGGSPGSCAGGVKTTSAAVLYAIGRGAIRGRDKPDLFRRTIPEAAVRQAQAVCLLAACLLVGSIFALHVIEEPHVGFRQGQFNPIQYAFEAVSAFGTVGLSTGITPHLSAGGKGVLILLMYVGRLGPLTFALLLARRRAARYRYAEEGVLIG